MLFPLTTMRAFVARDLSANRNTQAYLKANRRAARLPAGDVEGRSRNSRLP